jgi:hypothetical protein
MPMTWCVTARDVVGHWSWREPRQWTDAEFQQQIQAKLDALTSSTWGEIHQMFSGGLQCHHEQPVVSLIAEVQDRWAHIGVYADTTFRFRLTGSQRAWGFREGAHFKMVWYDREHRFFPVEKSHT